MIIDIHYHYMLKVPEGNFEDILAEPIRLTELMNQPVDMPAFIERTQHLFPDPDGRKLISNMDASGIDVTTILVVDHIETLTTEMILELNRSAAEVARNYPDRVNAFASVDPRREDAEQILRLCFEEFNMKGLKYHPDAGYDPAGPESYKLLEIVQSNNGVLLSHTGPLAPPSRCNFADPSRLADIGVDFPDLKVVAAHMGYVNWRSWAALAIHQPNLYGDLAMWDAYAFGRYDLFCRELRDIIDFVGVEKVLFGTDDPYNRIARSTKNWIQLIKDLPQKAPAGIRFTEAEVKAMLGGNAAKLLGLA